MSNKKIEVQNALSPDPRAEGMATDLVMLVAMSTPTPEMGTEVAMLLLADLVVHSPGNREANIAKAKELFEAHIERALEVHKGCMKTLEAAGIQTAEHNHVH